MPKLVTKKTAAPKKVIVKHVKPVDVPEEEADPKAQVLSDDDKKILDHLSTRVTILKAYRKKALPGITRSIEDIWRDADREYTPHELQFEKTKVRFESDEETGLRSRLVKVGTEEDWQSNMASPELYVKVNSALSILVEMNPEATFEPAARKYEAMTELAYANWKQSWEVSGARHQMKNFVFNLGKYGTGVGRTYPKKIEMVKKIRTEYYKGNPDKDVYIERNIVKFDGLFRESLNPWQVWFSELARPGDMSSMDDWYWEKNYSWDKFQSEFKDMDIASVKKGMYIKEKSIESAQELPQDTITVGFYESQHRDQYLIWIPSSSILIYKSPLTNDDGLLSLWYAQWSLRDDRSPWGIGIYEIIRQDAVMYDRLKNMTMDQLTLSIYKMFFYKGTDILGENGQLVLSPGKGEQVSDPKAITFVEVPGAGEEAWRGLDFIKKSMDETSGVSQQITGNFGGKTLGQDLQAKDASLERLKTPLDYILAALEQEAYLSLSWIDQIMSTPQIMEYEDFDALAAALKEMGLTDQQIAVYQKEATEPTPDNQFVFSDEEPDENGKQKKFANVYREVGLKMTMDQDGVLQESKDRSFYRFGLDLPIGYLKWRGIVRVKPKSVLVPSKDLEKRMKLDLFNLLYPAIQSMMATPQHIPGLLPPIQQIIKVFDEDIRDWMDKDFFDQLLKQSQQPPADKEPEPKMSVAIKFEMLGQDVQTQILQKYLKVDEQPQNTQVPGGAPSASQVPMLGAPSAPSGSSPQPTPLTNPSAIPPPSVSRVDKSGGSHPGPQASPAAGSPTIKPLAQIGHTPSSPSAALEGARRNR